jgi:putative membrane protein
MKFNPLIMLALTALAFVSIQAQAQNNDTSASANSNQKPTAAAKSFITEAIKGDNSEVILGNLAIEKGQGSGIHDFGQTLVTDHEQNKKDAMNLAGELGIQSTDAITPEANKEKKKLEGMSGDAFDKEFAMYMIKDHKKHIAKFEKQAKGNDATADFARKTLPTLQKHLDLSESLNK